MLATIVYAVLLAADSCATHPLQPLDFLVGSCWRGELPEGRGVDTHCFAPAYGGKFVRDTHVVRGKGPDYEGETIYAWDPQQQHIVFWYWGSSGVIEHGSVSPSNDGLEFPEHELTEPKALTYRMRWRRLDADRYEALNEQKDGDTWTTAWKVEYRRVKKTGETPR